MLIYALVNCAFSGFASLKLHLFIQPLKAKRVAKFSHPTAIFFVYKILTNASTARPRCERAFFSSALISANDLSYPSGMNKGS